MAEFEDQLVFNSISARALKAYFTAKINEMVDELVTRKCPQKKKSQAKKPEVRIPVDLVKSSFVKKFGLCNYGGILISLINSLVENNFFTKDGKLDDTGKKELVLTDVEKRILNTIDKSSPLYIDISDVKVLAARLKRSATQFNFNGHTYHLENDKIEDLINQLVKDESIQLDEKSSIKDSMYVIPDELIDVLKTRLFRSPQVKDNIISRTRLYDYFTRVTKRDESSIYVILKDPRIANILSLETVKMGAFMYTKHSMLTNAISSRVDRYSKKFQESFYEDIAEFVKENERVNVSRVVECLTVPNITISSNAE
ncbi:DNA-binding core protein [Cowpox virus]|uniref:Telomere-binding protein OPG077 n=1 Tax=Cowpox virus TaxID=10243 RepID=G0XV71_COWPX|nr:DNA-binding core protein [Cowpox virus]ADZ29833.1 DNA-binding core protein [Cowpox virus]ADZ30049.1 DNA-binding core protein [Cowpox virus]AGY97748.1 CPXV080 protein [Cowpox virus]AGY98823.1 CPXV080 protein [Cowpox virus]